MTRADRDSCMWISLQSSVDWWLTIDGGRPESSSKFVVRLRARQGRTKLVDLE